MSVDFNFEFTADKQAVTPHYSCLMSSDSENPGICNYAMAAASISLLVSAAVSLLQVRASSVADDIVTSLLRPAGHSLPEATGRQWRSSTTGLLQTCCRHITILMPQARPARACHRMMFASLTLLPASQCITCDLCGCGGVLDFVLGAAGTGWWIAASVLLK
jgi:hypothetical protein